MILVHHYLTSPCWCYSLLNILRTKQSNNIAGVNKFQDINKCFAVGDNGTDHELSLCFDFLIFHVVLLLIVLLSRITFRNFDRHRRHHLIDMLSSPIRSFSIQLYRVKFSLNFDAGTSSGCDVDHLK